MNFVATFIPNCYKIFNGCIIETFLLSFFPKRILNWRKNERRKPNTDSNNNKKQNNKRCYMYKMSENVRDSRKNALCRIGRECVSKLLPYIVFVFMVKQRTAIWSCLSTFLLLLLFEVGWSNRRRFLHYRGRFRVHCFIRFSHSLPLPPNGEGSAINNSVVCVRRPSILAS